MDVSLTITLPSRAPGILSNFKLSQTSSLSVNELQRDFLVAVDVIYMKTIIKCFACWYIWHRCDNLGKGVALVQRVGHGFLIREVPCLVLGGSRLCQYRRTTSNIPVPHHSTRL